ncbi:MAG: hypothetical protein K9J37_15430 [Saprospiraceae bacterium]|nr:hypothetical protein [Saprospiraceae bacterium]MCF8251302.1 hypothetical protein [Saprospiraceae bacterium]MCF8280603.1 hypothetical protein [Bacteroidales bacterium]MCF8313177.1 hypothetical protein [Saprospiraceae bacterium]MCF8441659.1 hypothetical protein [Saprospiraceae bacterium]
MTNVWDFFKNFFREAEQSSASRPILRAALVRSAEEKEIFENWKDTLVCRRIISSLAEGYAMYQSMPESVDRAFTFLNTPSSKGFAIHFSQTDYSRQDASHLLDLLQGKVRLFNYRLQHSDTRTWSEKDWVQTVERYYLKPRQSWAEGQKIDQLFGNITIELTLRNDQPYLLTFRATCYSDRLYADAADFHELMQAILS